MALQVPWSQPQGASDGTGADTTNLHHVPETDVVPMLTLGVSSVPAAPGPGLDDVARSWPRAGKIRRYGSIVGECLWGSLPIAPVRRRRRRRFAVRVWLAREGARGSFPPLAPPFFGHF